MSIPIAEPATLEEGTLRVIPLGGLGEVGRNMTVFEFGGKLLIVDCGVLFPEEHQRLEPLVRAVMTHVPGTVAAKYILHGLGRISSPRVRLPLVGPEEWEAALIEDELDLVQNVAGADFSNFRPDRNAAAGGALPKVHGTTR